MTQHTLFWSTFEYGNWTAYVAATEEGLCYAGTPQEDLEVLKAWAAKRLPGFQLVENDAALACYKTELKQFLEGKRTDFTQKISLNGTPFQQSVWEALRTIPFSETTSYSAIAEQIGNPKAVRAVGAAIGANPILIVVPCHRVVGKNGALTGFRGGLEMKTKLLELEEK
ncbi:methylated-DNA--[protein]-cysteine S-methyltransferase [Sporosarcina sp. HYO08]|uniref:methylated-DNA--[protein]-cysteine S-methyltransferase n=1 Tax=Sporosarcina sp. HYO08 TaxID=1759557 RepID=UPI000791D3EE|nr:methylated-DNA--[protein]-cysteine S-methyltransferase [Sporosarcina sp. HYO08]KXH83761.1 cysteine methyltransferase [Sporosarcina sp. HYO08]